MDRNQLDRREFQQWTLAALAGLTAGGTLGCGGRAGNAPAPTATAPASTPTATVALTPQEELLVDDLHVCRGLNTCKGRGRSKDNACAGQGTCASVADHACGGAHECKGQAGCGELPGQNACKTEGGCHVPLMDEVWDKARTAFETAMKKQGKTVGTAPAKAS
ncbi:MAG TPA: hypothetical protein VFG20_06765 [Planctomycetaceae bacterium]|jgi:hypothetical protein|nr:hypothetical protein [Planctomycetaceae bacterium]